MNLPAATASTPPGTPPLLSPAAEARVFGWMRRRLVANLVRQALREARLRVVLVLVLSTLFWAGLFLLFIEAFRFLATSIDHPATRAQAVQAVFGVFFASLLVMLLFSSGIILYGSLYTSREVHLLFTLPVRAERIFLHKFHEALLFSSWAFLLLGSPMLVAYGLVDQAPGYYYLLILPFMVSFVVIPGALGALACLVIVWRLPTVRHHAVGVLGTLLALLVAWVGWSLVRGPESDLLTPGWFEEVLGRLRFSQHRLLPNWWLSTGLLTAASDDWAESVLFLALLVANALAVHQLAVAAAGRLLRPGYQALAGFGSPRRRLRGAWIDGLIERAVFFLSPQMRLLVVKDVRLFRRDPVQWSQFLIFLGLLALYFVNVRRFRYDVQQATWVNLVSFLNLTVVGLILSTFTSRFVFPMISLEGRRFWILGLLPVRRETILWSKFLFAALGTAVASTLLVVLSDLMLRVLPAIMLVHLLVCWILCAGLSGIAVGLGAKMPNLREESPSKIAAGFGGTLNLVLSALFIVAVVGLAAVPSHFYVAAWQTDASYLDRAELGRWVWAGTGASVVLGVAATILPMRMGVRAFRELEF